MVAIDYCNLFKGRHPQNRSVKREKKEIQRMFFHFLDYVKRNRMTFNDMVRSLYFADNVYGRLDIVKSVILHNLRRNLL